MRLVPPRFSRPDQDYSTSEWKDLASGLRSIRANGVIQCVSSLGLGQLWLNLYPFPLRALQFGIAFHHQLVLLSFQLIFLLPYHILKRVSFLGANRTKIASVGPKSPLGRYINTWIQYNRITNLIFSQYASCLAALNGVRYLQASLLFILEH